MGKSFQSRKCTARVILGLLVAGGLAIWSMPLAATAGDEPSKPRNAWQSADSGFAAERIAANEDSPMQPLINRGDCQVICAAGAIPEGEPTCADQYIDQYNHGCADTTNGFGLYTEIGLGTTVCGHSGTFYVGAAVPARDEDYYEFTVTESTEVTWTVTAEFPVSIGLIDDTYPFSCWTATTLAENTGAACGPVSITLCVAAGRYVVWVMPDTYEGVPCGSGYEATLVGQSCGPVVVGACCHLDDGSCDEAPQYRCDAVAGGVYQGDGVACSEVSCEPPVTADDCYDAVEVAVPSSTWAKTSGSSPDLYPDCGLPGIEGRSGVWVKVIGTGHQIKATTCNRENLGRDTILRVYCGDCDNAVCVGASDEDCTTPAWGDLSTVVWCSALGQEYYILVVTTTFGDCRLDILGSHLPCDDPAGCVAELGACCVDGVCVADNVPEYKCEYLAPNAAWLVGESCAGAICPSCPGNTCADAIAIDSLPFSAEGDTCQCGHDYDDLCGDGSDYQSGRDVVYAYTPSQDVVVDIRTCRGSDFDTLLYVYENVCQAEGDGQPPYACGDNSCVSPQFTSNRASAIDALPLTAGNTYYIVVDSGLSNAADPRSCGQYTLDVVPWTAINLQCPVGARVESEACGENTNEGCDLDTAQFEPIAVGESVCGTCWSSDDPQESVVDWYEVVVTEDSVLTWTVTAEFWVSISMPAVFPPGSGDCADYAAGMLYALEAGAPGEEISFTMDCLPPGTYWFTVEYGPGHNSWPCNHPNLGNGYVATVTAEPCSLPKGACCHPDGTCELQHEYWCGYEGGHFTGNGTNCLTTQCQPFPCGAFGECQKTAISEVVVGDIVNESSCGGYEDYTYLSTIMYPGESYSLWFGYGSTLFPDETGGAWVDWNHDLDFEDPGEQIELQMMVHEGGFAGVVVPPLDAVPGMTTLRLRTNIDNVCEPCEGSYYGEVEDYTIQVMDIPGACCSPDGQCYTLSTAAECAAYGGAWFVGESCIADGGSFVCPIGACCVERECLTLAEGPCLAQGGTWYIGETCAADGGDFSCPYAGLSACCTYEGECIMVETESQCLQSGAIPGVYHPGEWCEDDGGDFNGCLTLGACCRPGTCTMTTMAECWPGIWHAGEVCIENGGDWNCRDDFGACCSQEGDCVVMASASDCYDVFSGTWHPGELCVGFPGGDFECQSSGGGACCAPSGVCYSTQNEGECMAFYGGTFYAGEDCASFTCPTSGGGACCTPSGVCHSTQNEGECMAFYGGTYYAGEDCASFTCPTSGVGACCAPDGTCQGWADEGQCQSIFQGTWYPGEDCSTFTCPTSGSGACCTSSGVCHSTQNEGECMAFYGGTFYAGEDCSTFTCPTSGGGACCTSSGACHSTQNEGECMAFYSGTFYAGEDCATFTCPTSGSGACCAPDGYCVGWADEAECQTIIQGTWYPGEDCDAGFVCPASDSACCTSSGECVMVADAMECMLDYNGNFFVGETCFEDGGDFVCPEPGACCAPDGTCVPWADEAACQAVIQGTWHVGEDCDAGFVCPIAAGWCDLDGNEVVDYDDYVIFLAAFGGPVDGDPAQDADCDYDGSGAVGLADYNAWLQCYRDSIGDPFAGPPSAPEATQPGFTSQDDVKKKQKLPTGASIKKLR